MEKNSPRAKNPASDPDPPKTSLERSLVIPGVYLLFLCAIDPRFWFLIVDVYDVSCELDV